MQRAKTRIFAIVTAAMLALSMFALAACEKSEFGVTENTGKLITIDAKHADEGDFVLTGQLDVEEGEQIAIKGDLSEGTVKIEITEASGSQSSDKPDGLDGEPIITANITTTDGATGTVSAGSYMVKATCLEKTSGTVRVEVEPVA